MSRVPNLLSVLSEAARPGDLGPVHFRGSLSFEEIYNPKALRTHILRLLGPKTILHKAFGLF